MLSTYSSSDVLSKDPRDSASHTTGGATEGFRRAFGVAGGRSTLGGTARAALRKRGGGQRTDFRFLTITVGFSFEVISIIFSGNYGPLDQKTWQCRLELLAQTLELHQNLFHLVGGFLQALSRRTNARITQIVQSLVNVFLHLSEIKFLEHLRNHLQATLKHFFYRSNGSQTPTNCECRLLQQLRLLLFLFGKLALQWSFFFLLGWDSFARGDDFASDLLYPLAQPSGTCSNRCYSSGNLHS